MTDHMHREQIRRIVAAFNVGRYDNAHRLCEAALKRKPGDPALNHLFAAVLFAKGEVATSRVHINASLEARFDNASAQLLAGRIARAAQDFGASLRHLAKAAALAPGAEVLLEQARTLDAAGARDAAREAWSAVLRTEPLCREAAARLGRLLFEDGMLVEAASLLELAATGDASASTWFDLGLTRQDLRDLVGAATAYGRALELRPNYAEAAVNLGVTLQDSGDMNAAIEAYRTAYSLREETFGMIATSLASAPHGRLWLDREALKRLLRG